MEFQINKSLINNIFIPVFVLLIYAASPLYDKFSNEYINDSLKQSFVTYAIVRSFNAVISTLQESSISVGIGVDANIAIGQVLDPINDAVERFSDMITISLWTLGAEKIVYEISKLNIFYIIIFLLIIVSIFKKSDFLKKILLFLIVIRLFIPFSAVTSFYIDKKIFQPNIEKYQNILNSSKLENNSLNITSIKKSIKYYLRNKTKILNALINLSMNYFAKFLFNLILLPLFFVWFIKNLVIRR